MLPGYHPTRCSRASGGPGRQRSGWSPTGYSLRGRSRRRSTYLAHLLQGYILHGYLVITPTPQVYQRQLLKGDYSCGAVDGAADAHRYYTSDELAQACLLWHL